MRKLLVFIFLLALLCNVASAESDITTVYVGNYEYDVDNSWYHDISTTGDEYNFHWETGDVTTGIYSVVAHDPHGFDVLLLDDLEKNAEILFDIYIDAFVTVDKLTQCTEISIDPQGHAGILPHKSISGVCSYSGTELDMFIYCWVDWEYIYVVMYCNPTVSKAEATELFTEMLNQFYRSGTRPITIEGNDVSITDTISIKNIPSRVLFEQSEPGEFSVSCLLGNDNYEVVDGFSTDIYGSTAINKTGDYTFMIESEKDWNLIIEPMKHVEFEPITGEGDYVSDIYTIDKPCIVTVNAEYIDRDNLMLDAFIKTDHDSRWKKEYLLNEVEDDGFSKEYKMILKIAETSDVYFVLNFDEGKWELDLQ